MKEMRKKSKAELLEIYNRGPNGTGYNEGAIPAKQNGPLKIHVTPLPKASITPEDEAKEGIDARREELQAFWSGFKDIGSFGLAPKIEAGLGALFAHGLRPDLQEYMPQNDEDYKEKRDELTKKQEQIAEAHPIASTLGGLAGFIPATGLMGPVGSMNTFPKALRFSAAYDMLHHLGADTREDVDTFSLQNLGDLLGAGANGTLAGGVGYGLGKLITPVVNAVGRVARKGVNAIDDKFFNHRYGPTTTSAPPNLPNVTPVPNQSRRYNTRVTPGQAYGSPEDLYKESATRRGQYGSDNEGYFHEWEKAQQEEYRQAAKDLANRIGREEFVEKGAHAGPVIKGIQDQALAERKALGITHNTEEEYKAALAAEEAALKQKAAAHAANKLGEEFGVDATTTKGEHLYKVTEELQQNAKEERRQKGALYQSARDNKVKITKKDAYDFPIQVRQALKKLGLGEKGGTAALNFLDDFVNLFKASPNPWSALEPSINNTEGTIIQRKRTTAKKTSTSMPDKNIMTKEARVREKQEKATITNIRKSKQVTPKTQAIDLNQFQDWKQAVNSAYRSAKGHDKTALGVLKSESNKFLERISEKSMTASKAINQFKQADIAEYEYSKKYKARSKTDYAGKFIEDIIENDYKGTPYTNEQIADKLISLSEKGFNTKTGAVTRDLKHRLSPEAFDAIRTEVSKRLLSPLQEMEPNIKQYITNLKRFMRDNPTLAMEVFNIDQRRAFAFLLSDLGKIKVTPNPAIEAWFKKFSPQHASESGKQFLSDIVSNALYSREPYTNEQFVNNVFGTALHTFDANAVHKVREIKINVSPDLFRKVKLEAVRRLMGPILGNDYIDIRQFRANLNRLLTDDPALAKELFTKGEIALLNDFAKFGEVLFDKPKNILPPTQSLIRNIMGNLTKKIPGGEWMLNKFNGLNLDQVKILEGALPKKWSTDKAKPIGVQTVLQSTVDYPKDKIKPKEEPKARTMAELRTLSKDELLRIYTGVK